MSRAIELDSRNMLVGETKKRNYSSVKIRFDLGELLAYEHFQERQFCGFDERSNDKCKVDAH
ncbi:MAG: hypothetical protein QMD12_00430 [Candidatus Aenigmarchaeota archaeon]|nr:hypothetical protein [Candidatus Aenigmarchaeota archaeon]